MACCNGTVDGLKGGVRWVVTLEHEAHYLTRPMWLVEVVGVLDLLDTNCNCPGRGELSARPEQNTTLFWSQQQVKSRDNRYENI